MTDVPADEPADPYFHAERVTDRILWAHVAKTSLRFLLAGVAQIALTISLRVFGILALWHVPVWAVAVLSAAIAADVTWRVVSIVNKTRKRRAVKAERIGMTSEQRAHATLSDMRNLRAEIARMRPLRRRMAKPSWWIRHALAVVYLFCVVLVLADRYGTTVGIVVASAMLAVGVVVNVLGRRMAPGIATMSDFVDPRSPRDSPEM